MYTLKPGVESLTVVEGPCAGRTYQPGATYEEIPPQEAKKFEEIKTSVIPAKAGIQEATEATKPTGKKAGGGEADASST